MIGSSVVWPFCSVRGRPRMHVEVEECKLGSQCINLSVRALAQSLLLHCTLRRRHLQLHSFEILKSEALR